MSARGTYTAEGLIERYTQINVTATSNPNSSGLQQWINEIEAGMDARLLGNYHSSGYVTISGVTYRSSGFMFCDVLPVEGIGENTSEWLEYITRYGYSPSAGKVVVPEFIPIISIDQSGCWERTIGLGTSWAGSGTDPFWGAHGVSSGVWDLLVEGQEQNFIQLKKPTKTGRELGFALYFFENAPATGVQRIRLSYHYGWNVPTNILREYATLKTSQKLIFTKISTSQPGGLTQFQTTRLGGFTRFAQIDFDRKLEIIEQRCEEIELDYFPEESSVPIAVF